MEGGGAGRDRAGVWEGLGKVVGRDWEGVKEEAMGAAWVAAVWGVKFRGGGRGRL